MPGLGSWNMLHWELDIVKHEIAEKKPEYTAELLTLMLSMKQKGRVYGHEINIDGSKKRERFTFELAENVCVEWLWYGFI